MTTETATTFFALLTLGALAVALVGAALAGAHALHPAGARAADWVRSAVAPSALSVAAVVAVTAMLGSLYYSEVAGFTPCTLCWYQRAAMYPLALLLTLAAVRGDVAVRGYAVPLAGVGALLSVYHYQLEWFPAQASVACTTDAPCTLVWFRAFGFVSLPFMALAGFAAVITLLLAGRRDAPDAGASAQTGTDSDSSRRPGRSSPGPSGTTT